MTTLDSVEQEVIRLYGQNASHSRISAVHVQICLCTHQTTFSFVLEIANQEKGHVATLVTFLHARQCIEWFGGQICDDK